MLYLIAGPSGIGKTTIINLLRSQYSWSVIPTYTTRELRINESDRLHISRENFLEKFYNGEIYSKFLYAGNLYGESFSHIEEALSNRHSKWCLDISIYKVSSFANSNSKKIILHTTPDQLSFQLEACGRHERKEQALKELLDSNRTILGFRNSENMKILDISPNSPENTARSIDLWHEELQYG